MKNASALTLFLLLAFTACWCSTCYAQNPVTVKTPTDSVKLSFVKKMQLFAKSAAKSSAADFAADKAAIAQVKIFNNIKKTMQRAKVYLRAGIDTLGTKDEIAQIKEDFTISIDGVLINRGSSQTFRNLTASSKIITELLNKATARKTQLDVYTKDLSDFQYQLDSLMSLPDLFKFPTDSAALVDYVQQIRMVNYEIHPIDSKLKIATSNAQKLSKAVNLEVLSLQASIEEIELYQMKMAKNSLNREFNNLYEPATSYRPFNEILTQAKEKGMLTLIFYLQDNIGKVLCLFILIVAASYYLRSLKAIYIKKELLTNDMEGQLVLRHPVASAILIVVCLFQFFFLSPPFILNVILWVAASISLSIIFQGYIVKYWMLVWLGMVTLFIIASLDNLILQASRSERWFILVLSLTGVVAGIKILLGGRKQELRERLILVAIGLMVVIEFGSAVSNIFGRYNFAKALLIAGYLNVVIAILFLWTIRLINEGLYLAFSIYTHQDPKLFYLNFDKVGKKVPMVFYLALILGWITLFGRNFAGFNDISGPLREFFAKDRTIGDYTFSINSLLLFVVIMGISVAVSKIVSFFASDKHFKSDKDHSSTKRGLGSWLLLVRIFILSTGLFLAIAATGVPLDRITLVIGALGVGIGFGLQTLVNNLVSGLIIAFEKPVNVGDIIELDSHSGVVKSIGFRSSVISTYDGANVILPNGDLLNAHLINWSLGGNKKRLAILIGISYDSDLDLARKVILELLEENEDILKNPLPSVQYEEFGESAIDVKILVWTKDLKEGGRIKNDLIIAINTALRANNIEIPYPKRDLHVRSQQPINPIL